VAGSTYRSNTACVPDGINLSLPLRPEFFPPLNDLKRVSLPELTVDRDGVGVAGPVSESKSPPPLGSMLRWFLPFTEGVADVLARYIGAPVAFLTKHGKQALVAEPLEVALGCRLIHTDGFDTDQLGTFSREIHRLEGQRDTARRKAGIKVTGIAQGPALAVGERVSTVEQLHQLAERAGFPEHLLMVRSDDEHHAHVIKAVGSLEALQKAYSECLDQSIFGGVFVGSDLRAFANPTRQAMIRSAAQNLAQRLESGCPRCEAPGFWPSGSRAGLPCRDCGSPTRLPVSLTWSCIRCDCVVERASDGSGFADPSRCDVCNP
jgi:hypothetical protein